ncbi:general stress protein [Salinicoccus sp. ID82-1]|uniref:Uncharacterized protein n=1 Tax=Salinicoccus cyprini TaxID=2493691 RepID=A0A558AUR8_9STAP|nr:general stress protein [Salinicoccus cyprini]MCG1010615.1 general stress protein [Salinicoccus sp. ID82-1]TVT28020.1 hypothetical protein FO441_06285 [Salinicoccus cyprini]
MIYFELYDSQEAVLDRMAQLKSEGYYEEDIHLLGRDDREFDALEYTEVTYHMHVPDDRGLKEILARSEPAERFLHYYLPDEDEVERYLYKISEGNYLMFYTDYGMMERRKEDKDESAEADFKAEARDPIK